MISIVIPAWNQHSMTADCIEAVKANTSDYEIILVDNGSDPPLPGATIRNDRNLGFPVAVNQGIRASKGDVIILLNNDVVVTPGWTNKLIRGLDTFAIVGPMTNYASGVQQAKVGMYRDEKEMCLRSKEWGDKNAGTMVEVNWVVGFLMAFRRSLYDELGEFDESLWPCSGEELDFCYKARDAGYKIGIIFDCYVHHVGSVTFKMLGNRDYYDSVIEKNHEHLIRRWGVAWRNQTLESPLVNPGSSMDHFTGERAMPLDPIMDKLPGVMREHWERYLYAVMFVGGKDVLDVACGAGYGADLMAGRTAKTVVGADISEEAIAYCKANYRQPNMKFEVGDVRSLSYADKSFDAVTCFETIEHVVDGNAVMREVARVLKDDGTALISTPLGGPCGNEYHVAYYQRGTFEVILRQFFDDVVVNYQRNETFQSQSISPEYADTFTGEYAMALCRKPVRGEG